MKLMTLMSHMCVPSPFPGVITRIVPLAALVPLEMAEQPILGLTGESNDIMPDYECL